MSSLDGCNFGTCWSHGLTAVLDFVKNRLSKKRKQKWAKKKKLVPMGFYIVFLRAIKSLYLSFNRASFELACNGLIFGTTGLWIHTRKEVCVLFNLVLLLASWVAFLYFWQLLRALHQSFYGASFELAYIILFLGGGGYLEQPVNTHTHKEVGLAAGQWGYIFSVAHFNHLIWLLVLVTWTFIFKLGVCWYLVQRREQAILTNWVLMLANLVACFSCSFHLL